MLNTDSSILDPDLTQQRIDKLLGIERLQIVHAFTDADEAQRDRLSLAGGRAQKVAEKLAASEKQIVTELIAAQGKSADIGGYYQPHDQKAFAALRPSATLNAILESIDEGILAVRSRNVRLLSLDRLRALARA